MRTGILPSQFDALGEEDKAYLVQYWRTTDAMEAWEAQQQAEEAEKKPKQK